MYIHSPSRFRLWPIAYGTLSILSILGIFLRRECLGMHRQSTNNVLKILKFPALLQDSGSFPELVLARLLIPFKAEGDFLDYHEIW